MISLFERGSKLTFQQKTETELHFEFVTHLDLLSRKYTWSITKGISQEQISLLGHTVYKGFGCSHILRWAILLGFIPHVLSMLYDFAFSFSLSNGYCASTISIQSINSLICFKPYWLSFQVLSFPFHYPIFLLLNSYSKLY